MSGTGGAIEITPGWPLMSDAAGILGRTRPTSIHPDDRGNLLLVEDAGGVNSHVIETSTSANVAKQPNSFVYWFVPMRSRTDLQTGGQLYACR